MGLGTPEKSAQQATSDMAAPRGRALIERPFQWALLGATLLALALLAALLADVLIDGAGRLSWDFLTDYSDSLDPAETGIRTGLTGTMSLMVLTAAISFPIGVGAAVYLEEYASDNRFTRLLQLNIANLAGVPSVVYGLLTLSAFVYVLGFGRSLLAGAMALSLLILPIIIVASREALRAVPQSIRNGALALGATPLQVTSRQVLPIALPGILTGTILALSRAIGESAPILVVGAVFSRRADTWPWELFEPFGALPIQIFNFVRQPEPGFQIEAASAGILVLLALLLTMNAVAIFLRNRYQKRF